MSEAKRGELRKWRARKKYRDSKRKESGKDCSEDSDDINKSCVLRKECYYLLYTYILCLKIRPIR